MINLEKAIKRNSYLKCVICGNKFLNRFYNCEIKKGNGVVCSRNCQNKLYSKKRRSGDFCYCIKCKKYRYYSPSTLNNVKKIGICGKCRRKEKTMSTDGYWEITISGYKRKIKEHRWLMEQKIGRKLSPNEIVHHLNFNKLDNRTENLVIVSRGEHNVIHKPHGPNPLRLIK